MNPDHHHNIREQYASESGAAFYRSVMGDGAPVIHYGIYDTPATPMREATENATRRLLDIALRRRGGVMPAEIIDLGSGPGGSAHLLARETCATVTCVDLCEAHHLENETLARTFGLGERIRTWTGSFERLPEEWNCRFDLAWSQEALCHSQDKTAALCEALRVLRPGGILVFSDILLAENAPAEEAEVFSKVNAVTRWSTASEHLRHLADAGFEEVVHHDWTPHLTENFRRMRDRIIRDRDALLDSGVSPDLLDRFACSLDQRIAWQPGSVLVWGVFACRSGGEC
jgi:sarcosine/dimethylglycine N-methyltransferase